MFLILRYPRETRFYKSLVERDDDLDVTSIATPKARLSILLKRVLSIKLNG